MSVAVSNDCSTAQLLPDTPRYYSLASDKKKAWILCVAGRFKET